MLIIEGIRIKNFRVLRDVTLGNAFLRTDSTIL